MSYTRTGPKSDVYVYHDGQKIHITSALRRRIKRNRYPFGHPKYYDYELTCYEQIENGLAGQVWTVDDQSQAVAILLLLVRNGFKVEKKVFNQLINEVYIMAGNENGNP